MPIITSTTLRNNLSNALDKVSGNKDYLLVSRRGKINSALINIDLLEDLLALNNQDYLNSIKKAKQEYETGQIFTHEQVFGEI